MIRRLVAGLQGTANTNCPNNLAICTQATNKQGNERNRLTLVLRRLLCLRYLERCSSLQACRAHTRTTQSNIPYHMATNNKDKNKRDLRCFGCLCIFNILNGVGVHCFRPVGHQHNNKIVRIIQTDRKTHNTETRSKRYLRCFVFIFTIFASIGIRRFRPAGVCQHQTTRNTTSCMKR